MLRNARMYYEYKRAVICMQHGITLRNALFNCVFTVVARCTLLPVGVYRSTAGCFCCLYPCMVYRSIFILYGILRDWTRCLLLVWIF
jgi:hypothetical protein